MPVATDSQVLTNVPTIPFVPNPAQFDASSQRNHHVQVPNLPDPGDGAATAPINIAQAGIISGIWIHYTGTLTVAGGSVTAKAGWPHNLLSAVDFSANFQSDVIHATGLDLHLHRWVSNPMMPWGGLDRQIGSLPVWTAGARTIRASWFVPLAADKASLIGAIYAQSASNVLTLQLRRALLTDVTNGIGGGVTATLTGSFSIAVDFFDIPRDPQTGAVVTPDLRRLHGLNFFDSPVVAAGRGIKVPMVPINGNLLRLFVRLQSPSGSFSPLPGLGSGFEAITLHYGGNHNPQQWDVASLVNRNIDHYGDIPPDDFVILDFLRENPVRDAVLMNGVTDLALLVDITPGTTIPAGTTLHVVQETLYS